MPQNIRMIERSHHDMGGQPAGKVRRTEHAYDDWELRVDAMMMLLVGIVGGGKRMTVDELRKNIESLPPADYDRMGYYDRWIISLTQTMIQRGVITTDELARKLAQVRKRGQTSFPGRRRKTRRGQEGK
jgi:Nitrile hydratase beta subunit, N-terminal